MKYYITTIVAALLFTTANAQDITAGLRTGIGKNIDANEFCKGDKYGSWNNEAYVRYQTKGKFAFEARTGHYKINDAAANTPNIYEFNTNTEGYFPGNKSTTSAGTNNYYLSFSTQYDITCPAMQKSCPIMKNIRNFIGVDIAGIYTNELINVEEYQNTGDIHNYSYNDERFNMQFGISHTIQYQLTEQLNINSSVRMMLNPRDFSAFNKDNGSQVGFMLGAGYKF